MSSSGTCAACDHSTVPDGTSTSCTLTRTSPGAWRSDPVTTASTPASLASARKSGWSAEYRDAARLDRTMSDSRPDSETVIASGRLNARKSIAGSGRSIRNGSTINRVVARAVTVPDKSPRARHAPMRRAISSAV